MLIELLRTLRDAIENGRNVALCRLVETRGSTPQKAGATMLVYEDGSQFGTLGGGCVEAEVKRRAITVINEGGSTVETFQLDSDYGWDDGLICGGRMKTVVEAAKRETHFDYVEHAIELLQKGEGITEAVVFDSGSSLPVPSTFLYDQASVCVRAVGAKSANAARISDSLDPISSRPRPYVAGGVAFLPVLPRSRLIIVGGGHVGKSVYEMAVGLDFDVWVIDDRAEYVQEDRFPFAQRRISGDMEEILMGLDVTADTFCLIVTRGHNHDQRALFHLVDRGARYVGMIGSRRKIRLIFDDLIAAGKPVELLQHVHAPVGIDIGSQTVNEIAVSIVAELVAFRNRGVVPGRAESVAAKDS